MKMFVLSSTVKPVYRDHPLGPNKLAAIERWPDYNIYGLLGPK